MKNSTILVPAALVVMFGGLACKGPKSQDEIQRELQAASDAGVQAFKNGVSRDANPYLKDKKDAQKAEAWYAAWDKAKAEKNAADQLAENNKQNQIKQQDDTAAKAAAEAEASAKAAELEKNVLAKEAESALKDINYAFDRSEIRETDKVKLQAIAEFMRRFSNVRLQLAGHCDERGTVEYNLALGDRRANAAKNYLVGLGITEDRLATISFGKERPKVQGRDEESWLVNRRCEFRIQ